jgi:hypothetical protein
MLSEMMYDLLGPRYSAEGANTSRNLHSELTPVPRLPVGCCFHAGYSTWIKKGNVDHASDCKLITNQRLLHIVFKSDFFRRVISGEAKQSRREQRHRMLEVLKLIVFSILIPGECRTK